MKDSLLVFNWILLPLVCVGILTGKFMKRKERGEGWRPLNGSERNNKNVGNWLLGRVTTFLFLIGHRRPA